MALALSFARALLFTHIVVVSDALQNSATHSLDWQVHDVTRGKLRLGYKHMSKCGGVFLNKLLRKMSPDLHTFFSEDEGLTMKRKRNVFVIASTRNPCDYYVSLWSYQHDKDFAEEQNRQHHFFDFAHPNHTNAGRFRRWLAWVQGPQFSVMSVRFWETLIVHQDGLSCWEDSLGTCTKELDDGEVFTGLSEFKPSQVADCWVYHETLMDDLERCLAMYEGLSGRKLDWQPFYDAKDSKENFSDHETCPYYFTPKVEASVMRTDRWMFEAFGYSTCCGAPTRPMK